MSDLCPVCGNVANFESEGFEGSTVHCLRCGYYKIVGTVEGILEKAMNMEKEKRILISGYIRDNQGILLTSDIYYNIFDSIKMPKVDEKVKKLCYYLKQLIQNQVQKLIYLMEQMLILKLTVQHI